MTRYRAVMELLPSRFVILDTETTGLEPERGHTVVEVAAQRIENRKVVDQFVSFVRPGSVVDPEAFAVSGITHEMLVGAPGSDEVLPKLADFLGADALVGHFLAFDLGFLNAHLTVLGRDRLANPTFDTKDLAKRLLILPSYALQNVANFLKVERSVAHRALADVETTREVLFKLLDRAAAKAVR
jgi:DNA polymerase III epsilon subunit family exonuclease